MGRTERKSTQTTKIFSERLSKLVEEKKLEGLSQKEIAEKINVSSGSLSEWCSDNKTPSIDVLPKIAEYFGVSVEWLVGCSNIRSSNIDIQAIHKKTGLSSEAIIKLKIDHEIFGSEYLPFLNRLITSDYLKDLSSLVSLYKHASNQEYIRLDMIPMTEELTNYKFQAPAFLKALITEYFFKIIKD